MPAENIIDVSNIIREYYNIELADKMEELFPAHTDEENYELERELEDKQLIMDGMEDEISQLNNRIDELEAQLDKVNDKIFESEI